MKKFKLKDLAKEQAALMNIFTWKVVVEDQWEQPNLIELEPEEAEEKVGKRTKPNNWEELTPGQQGAWYRSVRPNTNVCMPKELCDKLKPYSMPTRDCRNGRYGVTKILIDIAEEWLEKQENPINDRDELLEEDQARIVVDMQKILKVTIDDLASQLEITPSTLIRKAIDNYLAKKVQSDAPEMDLIWDQPVSVETMEHLVKDIRTAALHKEDNA